MSNENDDEWEFLTQALEEYSTSALYFAFYDTSTVSVQCTDTVHCRVLSTDWLRKMIKRIRVHRAVDEENCLK